MSIYKELQYGARPISRIASVQFSVLSPDEIRSRAACFVDRNDTYNGADAVPGGLFDTRMGVVDAAVVCATCEQKNTFCPGHMGAIELACPVFYIQFMDIVKKLLQCVCFRCARLLVALDSPDVERVLARRQGQKRWEAMIKLCKRVRRCGQETLDGCNARKPDRVERTDALKIRMEWRGGESAAAAAARDVSTKEELVLSAEDVRRILRRISDADASALGFSSKFMRPEWLICTVLPVPPPAVRPSVRTDGGARQEDDLTHKLADIVKYNNAIRQRLERAASAVAGAPGAAGAAGGSGGVHTDNLHFMLQYHVATLVDNNVAHMLPSKDGTGRVFRTLTDRLKHKEGRIRGNLLGKRVDFSARSVITPDPNISIDELGVPLKIAMNLTHPEVVNRYNAARLALLVRNGPDVYPGAKHVRKTWQGGRTIRLRGTSDVSTAGLLEDASGALVDPTPEVALEDGDVVERHLQDGDYVLFNRQPSLHKMSMMAHRVRVMEHLTFRLNVCVCASYNADFDGDEMNMHVPQSLQTAHELSALAAVPLHIISPRYSFPIVTPVQDILLAASLISRDAVTVRHRLMFNLVASNRVLDMRRILGAGSAPVTGRWLLSTILPPGVNAHIASKDAITKEPNVVTVKDSVITGGVMTVDAYKTASTGLVHIINNDMGAPTVTAFLDNTQLLMCDWLVSRGFSVGVSDLVLAPDKRAAVRAATLAAREGVVARLRALHTTSVFDNSSTMTNQAFLEDQLGHMIKVGMAAADTTGRVGVTVSNNRMLNMIAAGSKGKLLNWTQMVACVGQQNIDGQRVVDGFDHRTLPHFTKYDDGPDSRGFVEDSFIEGLTPRGFFFHAMGGRIGLIDTAVRSVTWETRVLILEDGRSKDVCIGEWIDTHLARANEDGREIQLFPQDRNLELCELDTEVFIPTLDAEGHVTWGRMTAVTRHDPGERLYKVTTACGRQVIVAESKSLLVWKPDVRQFMPTDSREVRVGDFMPVMAQMPPAPTSHITEAVLMVTEEGSPAGRFLLDWDNGTFIGIYLALGRTSMPEGQVSVSTIDPVVQGWVGAWFEKRGLAFEVCDSITVLAYSPALASFLDAFLGEGLVPTVAFNAPDAFVCGLLGGYFSGAGTVEREALSSSSASPRLNTCIALLCSRLGAFATFSHVSHPGVTPIHRLTVRAPWLKVLADKLVLILPPMQEGLEAEAARCVAIRHEHLAQEDVVLDPIASIEVLGVEAHPKLYDVTVPSTLNFVLLNGLGCRDTSDTGYIQRKLIKAMEDSKTAHDGTVRNATGHLLQTLYGEDGFDAIKLEYQQLPTLTVSVAEMRAAHLWADNRDFAISAAPLLNEAVLADLLLPRAVSWLSRHRAHFDRMLEDRRFVVRTLIDDGSDHTVVMCAVPFQRIVENAAAMCSAPRYALQGMQSDLSPVYVLDAIELLLEHMRIGVERMQPPLLGALLRAWLSPRPLIEHYRLSRLAFDRVCLLVRSSFEDALVNPSEMVGITSAQSVGEPTTQMTLNSVHYDTELLLRVTLPGGDKELRRVLIGDFVEAEIQGAASALVEKHPKDMTLAWLRPPLPPHPLSATPSAFEILSCDADGRVTWREVEAVTRHPVINDDGSDTLLRVTLRSGRTSVSTKGESFLTRRDNRLVSTRGDALQVGDSLPVSHVLPVEERARWDVARYTSSPVASWLPLDDVLGARVGAHLATTQAEVSGQGGDAVDELLACACGVGIRMRLPADLLAAPVAFVRALIGAFFGSADAQRLRRTSPSRGLLEDVQQLLLRVHGSSVVRAQTVSADQPMYSIDVLRTDRLDTIPAVVLSTGTHHDVPRNDVHMLPARDAADVAVIKRLLDEDIRYDAIVSIVEVPNAGRAYVYDLTVEGTRTFGIYSGEMKMDSFHFSGVATSASGSTLHGVARMRELIHVSRNVKTPYMAIHLRPDEAMSAAKCDALKSEIQTTRFRDLVTRTEIIYDPPPRKGGVDVEDTRVVSDREMLRFAREVEALGAGLHDHRDTDATRYSPWLLRFEFDRAVMMERRVSMLDLEHLLTDFYAADVSVLFSDDNAAQLVGRLRLTIGPDTTAVAAARISAAQAAIAALARAAAEKDGGDEDDDEAGGGGGGAPHLAVPCVAQAPEADLLTDLRAMREAILDVHVVKGITGIDKVLGNQPKALKRYDFATDSFVPHEEHVLATNGSNLAAVMINEHVDFTRVKTNDVCEVFHTLGIEAAVAVLTYEIRSVLQDHDVNFRHISLLVAAMTCRGTLMSVDRHGLNRGDNGVLARASFEEMADMLINAGVFADVDKVDGVSANIMLGQVAPCGTGECEVFMDEEAILRYGEDVPVTDHDTDRRAPAGAAAAQQGAHMVVPTPGLELPSIDENARVVDGSDVVFE